MFSANPAVRGFIIALAGYSFYTFGDTIMKSLSNSYPLQLRMCVAYSSAALTLFLIACLKQNIRSLKPHNFKIHLVRGIIVLLAQGGCFLAYKHMPMANVYSILYLVPLTVAALAGPFLKEWPSKRQVAMIALAWIGAIIIIRPGQESFNAATLFALGGMLMISVNAIYLRFFAKTENSLAFSFSAQTFVALFTLPFALPFFRALNLHDILLLMLMGFFNAFGMLFVTIGTQTAPAGRAAPAIYIQVLWGMLFGFVLFGDVPDKFMLIGVSIIVTAGLILISEKWRKV